MDYGAIVIGTGFGATIAATHLAALGKKTLPITWWITPEALSSPVMPKAQKNPLAVYLKVENRPVQYWSRLDGQNVPLDFSAAVRSEAGEKGSYQYSIFDQGRRQGVVVVP